MKKLIVATMTAVVMATATFGIVTFAEQTPHHYELHIVKSGDTLDNIILDANKGGNVTFDVRDAEAIAVRESAKMEGGAVSRQLQIGDKIAVPIYR
jgi:hypothetical protein